jgi:hypothetical protein
MILIGIVNLISLLAFTRYLMIVAGFFKGPVLSHFLKYGDDEDLPNLLTPLLGWGGLSLITGHLLALHYLYLNLPLFLLGLLCLALAYLTFAYPRWFGQSRGLVLGHPRWLAELMGRSSRLERRRLAYMWLHLPPRLRWAYSSHDQAFWEWADLVILATLY